MTPTKVHFSLEERVNVFTKNRKEWVLIVALDGDLWAITTWPTKPAERVVKQLEKAVMVSFKVYHYHLKTPQFQIEEI